MKKLSVKKILISIAIGTVICALLFAGGVYSVFYMGFPPNRKGIASLRSLSHSWLTDRDVYQVVQGGMDTTSIFRFQAIRPEIDSFVRDARMHEVAHDGSPVYWPPFTHPYWFSPSYTPSNKLYRSPENTSDSWVLYYETESHTAYFVYFET